MLHGRGGSLSMVIISSYYYFHSQCLETVRQRCGPQPCRHTSQCYVEEDTTYMVSLMDRYRPSPPIEMNSWYRHHHLPVSESRDHGCICTAQLVTYSPQHAIPRGGSKQPDGQKRAGRRWTGALVQIDTLREPQNRAFGIRTYRGFPDSGSWVGGILGWAMDGELGLSHRMTSLERVEWHSRSRKKPNSSSTWGVWRLEGAGAPYYGLKKSIMSLQLLNGRATAMANGGWAGLDSAEG